MLSAPEMHAWAPPCSLLLKSVLAPAEPVPHSDVSVSCHQAVLRAEFLAPLFLVHLLVLRESHSRSDHPPMTPVQRTAVVVSMMEFMDVAELAADKLVAGSAFLLSTSE